MSANCVKCNIHKHSNNLNSNFSNTVSLRIYHMLNPILDFLKTPNNRKFPTTENSQIFRNKVNKYPLSMRKSGFKLISPN